MALTEKQIIKALDRLNGDWPDDLFLFSQSGTLHLMRKGEDGNPVVLGSGVYDQEMIVKSWYDIENDGGDF